MAYTYYTSRHLHEVNFLDALLLRQGLFLDILKKLKLRKTQNSSQILKKLKPNLQKTQNLPTPLESSCWNAEKECLPTLLVQNMNV